MVNRNFFRNKKITVVGLARSGQACAETLNKIGAEVFVTDINRTKTLCKIALGLEKRGISVELGAHTKAFIKGSHLIVLSPGVPNNSKAISIAKFLKIPLVSEIELAYRLCPTPYIIAITGTNGKTTVTTLTGEILKKRFKRVFVLGNIGAPFCSRVLEMDKKDAVVLELSSFQLEYIEQFRPKVAVVLNFTVDHLDRHKDMNEYLSAKKKIFVNQGRGDYAVLNFDDPIVKSMSKSTSAKVVYFGSNIKMRDKAIILNHNHLASMAVGEIFGIQQEDILSVFGGFHGVEHRLEFVRSIDGIEFINDSKATNIDSTLWAFNTISKPIILIAGGRDKGSDFRTVRDIVRKKVKLLISIGEAKEKIQESFKDLLPTKEAKDLNEAVLAARNSARSGDCVLLSPMCASFDMFQNYEERGRIFKEIVNKI